MKVMWLELRKSKWERKTTAYVEILIISLERKFLEFWLAKSVQSAVYNQQDGKLKGHPVGTLKHSCSWICKMVNVPHCYDSTCQGFIKQTENISSKYFKCIFLSEKMYELHSEPEMLYFKRTRATRNGIVVEWQCCRRR